MFNLVIPVAGQGSRFMEAGYDASIPKPLIVVENGVTGDSKTLLQWSLDGLPMELVKNCILVTNRENDQQIRRAVHQMRDQYPRTEFQAVIDPDPRGQASSARVGIAEAISIDKKSPLMIANCDQWVKPLGNRGWAKLYQVLAGDVDFMVPTFSADESKWSFACVEDKTKYIAACVEKPVVKPACSEAIVGIFVYASTSMADKAIEEMMRVGDMVNGEFYIAPSLNYLIRKKFIGQTLSCVMRGIGTPEDVEKFSSCDISVYPKQSATPFGMKDTG